MRACLVLAVAVGWAGLSSRAEEPKKGADKVPTFKADIAPLFKDACASCHSGAKKKAKLDVTDYDSVAKFVKAGEPDKSKLHMSLLGKGAKQMPPKNPLAEDQVALVKAWITGGAKKE
jgi:mono/diheme cytochrome c family protein